MSANMGLRQNPDHWTGFGNDNCMAIGMPETNKCPVCGEMRNSKKHRANGGKCSKILQAKNKPA